MKVINADGVEEEVKFGSPLTGRKLKSITLEYKDIEHIGKDENAGSDARSYFYDVLATRLSPVED